MSDSGTSRPEKFIPDDDREKCKACGSQKEGIVVRSSISDADETERTDAETVDRGAKLSATTEASLTSILVGKVGGKLKGAAKIAKKFKRSRTDRDRIQTTVSSRRTDIDTPGADPICSNTECELNYLKKSVLFRNRSQENTVGKLSKQGNFDQAAEKLAEKSQSKKTVHQIIDNLPERSKQELDKKIDKQLKAEVEGTV